MGADGGEEHGGHGGMDPMTMKEGDIQGGVTYYTLRRTDAFIHFKHHLHAPPSAEIVGSASSTFEIILMCCDEHSLLQEY